MSRNRLPLSQWARRLRSRGLPGEPAARAEPSPLPAHPGLWLDRLLQWDEGTGPDSDEGWPAREALFEAAVKALEPHERGQNPTPVLETYCPIFRRWKEALAEPVSGVRRHTVELVTTSRVLLHPATGASVTDGSILLHHTYGVPYLPGSAIKSAARRGLVDHFGTDHRSGGNEGPRAAEPPEVGQILGSPREDSSGSEEGALAAGASRVDFLDALWIPVRPPGAGTNWSPLALDVVTPHHPSYYIGGNGGDGNRRNPLLDDEDPVPSQRLTLAPGCRFLVVAETATDFPETWSEWLLGTLLPTVLREEGLGAWTRAGYGRLRSDSKSLADSESIGEVAAPEWQEVVLRLKPNTGELTATLPDGTKAFAAPTEALPLRQALPEGAKKQLKTKKRASLEIKTKPEGLRRRIVGLRVPERGS